MTLEQVKHDAAFIHPPIHLFILPFTFLLDKKEQLQSKVKKKEGFFGLSKSAGNKCPPGAWCQILLAAGLERNDEHIHLLRGSNLSLSQKTSQKTQTKSKTKTSCWQKKVYILEQR